MRKDARITISLLVSGSLLMLLPSQVRALECTDTSIRETIETRFQDGLRGRDFNSVVGCGSKSIEPLMFYLQQQNSSIVSVRPLAADALGQIGLKDANVIKVLKTIIQNREDNYDVRIRASGALGQIEWDSPEAINIVSNFVQEFSHPEYQYLQGTVANSLVEISLKIERNKKKLDGEKLNQLITALQEALNHLNPDGSSYNAYIKKQTEEIGRNIELLQSEQQSRWQTQIIKWIGPCWLVHVGLWILLITIYPKYSWVQAIFFWNPKVRKFIGLWYVDLALTWIPYLRSKLFAPFEDSLLSDAHLKTFNPQAYFVDSDVKLLDKTETQPIQEAISEIRGQIILEGESGLGKSMFLRHLVQKAQRIAVYLPAKKCDAGVLEAIQAKLHGYVKEDPNFLKNLIYSGAIDICIDGLNEVTPDTRAKITSFVESYFKGNIIMATQPLEWTPPSTAKTYILQPLKSEQIEHFLISRRLILPEDAKVKGSDYEQACKIYLDTVLNRAIPEEEMATRRMLSNPMELTIVALMLSQGKTPDLLNLQQQQFDIMKADYERLYPAKTFLLKTFAEAVYQMRLNDRAEIAPEEWQEELQCLERHKMVINRQVKDSEGQFKTEWYFRHDKIQDFFIVQTFLGEPKDNRLVDHISDSRFRGVYFLLARLMPVEEAKTLRETLIQYAADTKDHVVSDTFIQLFRSRQAI